MKSAVVLTNKNIGEYKKCGTDCFLLPLSSFSVSYPVTFSLCDIKKMKEDHPSCSFFVIMNKMIFNHEIDALKQVLEDLDSLFFSGIFFYDMAFLKLKNQLFLKTPLIWNNTHMVTNSNTLNFLFEQQVSAAVISGELEKSEILSLVQNTKMPLFYTLLSHPIVAHSKRHLLTHYSKISHLPMKHKLMIHEKVSGKDYFVTEERDGVSFFDQMIPNHYEMLKELVCSYVILNESDIDHVLFMSLLTVTNEYLTEKKSYEDMYFEVEKLLGTYAPFLHQKTIYQVKKEGK